MEQVLRSVVITGASSGIGRATALQLAAAGFQVFASVRKPSDAAALHAASAGKVTPIELDVTQKSSITAALRTVTEALGERGLDGLVNNAGIAIPGPVEYLSDDALRSQFEVNTFGQIAVIQAFLPLIRRARGRIINIGSVGSHMAVPFGGALCSSKAAFSLLSDALRLELRPDGIHVCLIEPGAIHTPAVDKTLGDADGAVASLPPEGRARYEPALRDFIRHGLAREIHGSAPEIVAQTIERALTEKRPRPRYAVGAHARGMVTLSRLLPDRLLDQARLRALGLSTKFG
jgi:NAD(P)-dependent dehydrogenase (short-subunit alcohol dehydrogenase family)